MKRNLCYALLAGCVLLAGCDALLSPEPGQNTLKWKGMTFFFMGNERNRFETADFQQNISEIEQAGCNIVMLVPFWFQSDEQADSIAPHSDLTIPDDDFRQCCRLTLAAGLSFGVKPHIGLLNGQPRAATDPADRESWKGNYLDFILHYAEIAATEGAAIFCVGTELSILSADTELWAEVIAAVRNVYDGPLTYSPTPQEALSVRFWDRLEFIGVNAYFPLSKKEAPLLADFLFAWGYWNQMLRDLSRAYDRPLLLTEIGYINRRGAAADPGNYRLPGPPDERLQADLYRAALMAARESDVVSGMFWWQWELNDVGGPGNVDYTPRGKLAENVLGEFWR